jgi:hypothetical protein
MLIMEVRPVFLLPDVPPGVALLIGSLEHAAALRLVRID